MKAKAAVGVLVVCAMTAAGCEKAREQVSGPTPVETPPAVVAPSPFPTHRPHPPAPPVEEEEPKPGPGKPGKPKPQPTPSPDCAAHEPHGEEKCRE